MAILCFIKISLILLLRSQGDVGIVAHDFLCTVPQTGNWDETCLLFVRSDGEKLHKTIIKNHCNANQ